MPTKVEKDSVTGTETTGHEWDGIKELNTPLPRWWLYVLYATIVYSVIYYILYPSIPLVTTYTEGVIGSSARQDLIGSMERARERQSAQLDRIASLSAEEIAADGELLGFAVAGGRAAFADNCAPCHGLGGAGRPGGFPSLADDVWIWGGTMDAIRTTLLHGIRYDEDENTRISDMPAFGADELLSGQEILDIAEHILAFTNRADDLDAAARGATLYLDNCAACHGEEGEGVQELGAPRLNDRIWLYGGERADLIAQIGRPQMGVMPNWQGRLSDETIKMLTVYVHTLGGGE